MTGGAAGTEGGDASIRVGRVARQAGDRPLPKETAAPERQLAQAMENLSAAESRAATAEETAAAETARANAATATAAAATEARVADRETSLKNNLTQSKDLHAQAKRAYRAAREAGDLDGEEAALDTMTQAAASMKANEIELSQFEAAKPRILAEVKDAAKPKETPKGPTSFALAWAREHPTFNREGNEDYTAEVIKAQREAADGFNMPYGSEANLRFVSQRMERLFGKEHGREAGAEREDDHGRGNGEAAAMSGISSAAGPSRSGGGNGGGTGREPKLSYTADGKPQITGDIPAAWVEAAGWCNMTPVDYAIGQLEHQREAAAGKAVYSADGAGMVWRT